MDCQPANSGLQIFGPQNMANMQIHYRAKKTKGRYQELSARHTSWCGVKTLAANAISWVRPDLPVAMEALYEFVESAMQFISDSAESS